MLVRLGAFLARHPKRILAITGILVIGSAVVGIRAFSVMEDEGFDDPNSDSTRAAEVIEDRFGAPANLIFLIGARDGTADSPAVQQEGTELTNALEQEPAVSQVESYWSTKIPALASKDRTEALVLAHLPDDDEAEALIEKYSTTNDAVTVRAGGAAAVNNDIGGEVGTSLALAEAIAVPAVLILLVFAFGSVVAATIPLVIGVVAIFGTFAELFVLGSITDVAIYSVNLTTALGLGLGIDYALLIVSRFREELNSGKDVTDALVRTVATAGRTIVFSACTVAVALSALLLFPLYFLRSFAYAGIGVVAIAGVAALVVAPALLAVLGHRINAGKLPWSRAVRGSEAPVWGRLARFVMRRPALTALPVVAVFLFLASPVLGINFGTPDDRVLRDDVASRQVGDALRTDFATDASGVADVVVTGSVGADQLTSYARELSDTPGVARVDSSVGTFADGQSAGPGNPALGRDDAQQLTVTTSVLAKSGNAQDLVRDIRGIPGPSGAEVLVGGTDAELVDSNAAIGSRLPMAIGLVALTTFVILFLFTGSVVQPLRALVLNALSLSATLGIVVWIFQEGHLSSLLNFTPLPTDTAMTVLLLCIAFGLSMDYEIFLTSRIKELSDQGASTEEAVTNGLARTGRIVSTAAGLLAVTFFAFGVSTVSFLQLFGIGAAVAIILDATLVRGVLVPAVMRVAGRIIWYAPRTLRRVHARIGLEEG